MVDFPVQLSPMSAMSMMITPSYVLCRVSVHGRGRSFRRIGFRILKHLPKPVVAVVRNAYVVRQRKVHAIAGGNIVVSPLEPRAVKRQFVEYVVDHRIRHGLIRPEQRIAGVGVVVIRNAVFLFYAVVDELVTHLVVDDGDVFLRVVVCVHAAVDIRCRTERMVADVLLAGGKARAIRAVVRFNQIPQKQHAAVAVRSRKTDMHIVEIVLHLLVVGQSIAVDAPGLGIRHAVEAHDILVFPVRVGNGIPCVHPLVAVEESFLIVEKTQGGCIAAVAEVGFLNLVPLIRKHVELRFIQVDGIDLAGAACGDDQRMDAGMQLGKLHQRIERNAFLRQRVVQRIRVHAVIRVKCYRLGVRVKQVFAERAGNGNRDR
ncbi:hypothetical protein SDC9_120930 [bioreactor metagenome]|uniref:Uncharacterized protein n=1 Tax=bioreactor metagenome TaxID=1076179 RepID=A0A645CAJ2_9ZZZZ